MLDSLILAAALQQYTHRVHGSSCVVSPVYAEQELHYDVAARMCRPELLQASHHCCKVRALGDAMLRTVLRSRTHASHTGLRQPRTNHVGCEQVVGAQAGATILPSRGRSRNRIHLMAEREDNCLQVEQQASEEGQQENNKE